MGRPVTLGRRATSAANAKYPSLWDGLAGCWLAQGGDLPDLAKYSNAAKTGTGTYQSGYLTLGSGDTYNAGTASYLHNDILVGDRGFSCLARFRPYSGVTNGLFYLLNKDKWYLRIEETSNSLRTRFLVDGSGGDVTGYSSNYTSWFGRWNTAIVTWNGEMATGSAFVYMNGELINTPTGSGTNDKGSVSNPLYLFDYDTYNQDGVDFEGAQLYSRVLTPDEIQLLTHDFYAPLRPKPTRILFGTAPTAEFPMRQVSTKAPVTLGNRAKNAGDAKRPAIWDQLWGAWVPTLGKTGLVFKNASPGGSQFDAPFNSIDESAWVASEKGLAINVPGGSNDGMRVTTGDPTFNGCTFASWFNVSSFSTDYRSGPFTARDSNSAGANLHHDASTKAVFTIYQSGTSGNATGATSLSTGTWYLVVGVKYPDVTTLELFLNGVSDGTGNTWGGGAGGFSEANLSFGGQAGGAVPGFNGKLGPQYIWKRALQPSEIQALYADHLLPFRRKQWVATSTVSAGGVTLDCDSGTFTVSGTAATLTQGYLIDAATDSFTVTGTAATLTAGVTLSCDSGSYLVTGTAATLTIGYLVSADTDAFDFTGTAATLTQGYLLNCDAGAWTWTGTAATLSEATNPVLDAATGTFTVSGTAASLLQGYLVSADTDSFTISGTAADLEQGYLLNCDSGSFSWTGTTVSLQYSGDMDILDADPGSYTISGTAATLGIGYLLSSSPGGYTVTGTAASLLQDHQLGATGTTFTVSGTAGTLEIGYSLSADTVAYTVTGTAADTLLGRVIDCATGAYTITGSAAGLFYSIESVATIRVAEARLETPNMTAEVQVPNTTARIEQ